ncbi:helix-turn-helix domain-containing protein [Serratia marcescens]|uniref:AraC family transcriptional regulator n=1 Tax=Serratia TaxID=613 RepID=UPI000C132A7E|nr:helix-turn-helix transcriptional regulator [Serratia marcescens]QHI76128.1 helix-turn-helix domain-containing protein [Serratia sp. NGAS9]PHY83721.1 AraC family transcriptional regulator [Serratia marcescens]UKG74853.1 helix-turn-helix transcriptional regulator [Serratia marcescens]CAI1869962.1 HTH-type transcriptional repressor of iron proteins A [Serratia marcescens]BEM06785.1 AraC family transcriptional regulator [Serratia marcescens]
MPINKKPVTSPEEFNADAFSQAAIALHVSSSGEYAGQNPHAHRKGQLILSLHGAVSCEVEDALWLVPPGHAVWVPGEIPHSCRVTKNADTCFLFIEPGAGAMPEICCTLAITPLVRELVLYLAEQEQAYSPDSKTARLVAVLLEHIPDAPVNALHLPVSDHPKIRNMAEALFNEPDDRRTLKQWAAHLAISERSLARLIKEATGMSFGRWRQQLHLMIALSHLAEGQSVQHVAGMLGYDSVSAFITMFRKALGKSPTQYFSSLS